MDATTQRREALAAQFTQLCADDVSVGHAYAAVQTAMGDGHGGAALLWARIELVDALKKARMPEPDAKDVLRLIDSQAQGLAR